MVENSLSDAAIARRVLDGDKDAFGCWVDKYSDLVFAIVFRYAHERREALDLTQEVFVRAYQSLNEVNDYAIFDRWLARIAANVGLNWVRDRNNDKVAKFSEVKSTDPDEIPASEPGEEDTIFSPGNEVVFKALAKLPEKLRVIVLRKYMDDDPYAKIADDLGLSIATVRTRIARAKQIMKETIIRDVSRQSAHT